MKYIDNMLNRVTMYRLLVYALSVYAAWAVALSLFGKLASTPTELIMSLACLLAATYVSDRICAWLNQAPANSESWLITGLIMFLIIHPATTVGGYLALALAGIAASAGKTLIARYNKHVFNPAAFGAALVGVTNLAAVTWWVGGSWFWPLTLVLGLCVARKTRRVTMVAVFAAVSVALQVVIFAADGQLTGQHITRALISSPLIFLATIMLTEPATMPPRNVHMLIFAAGVAGLSVSGWHIGGLYFDPEVALLVGNVYAFAVSPKFRVRLRLKEIEKVTDTVVTYVFQAPRRFSFLPGQYMEWTLPHVPYDSRGNRRTFTIASSPTEQEIRLGVKFYRQGSAYKYALRKLQPGDYIFGSELAGNFTVDWQRDDKLLFIAGGIGITPFRSMVKYALDSGLQRDIVLLYAVSDAKELAYEPVFKEAEKAGVRYVPVTGKVLDIDTLRRQVPDVAERTAYISGPNAMVDAVKTGLRHLGAKQIVTDHFAGY